MFTPSPTMTHKGWFWFCPIYLDMRYNEYGPDIEARSTKLEWLFTLCTYPERVRLVLCELINPDWHAAHSFWFVVTDKLPVTDANQPTRAGYFIEDNS